MNAPFSLGDKVTLTWDGPNKDKHFIVTKCFYSSAHDTWYVGFNSTDGLTEILPSTAFKIA